MAASMWEWFDDSAATSGGAEIFKAVGDMVTGDQMDPAEVCTRMVELVEAETTEEHNFVPPELAAFAAGG